MPIRPRLVLALALSFSALAPAAPQGRAGGQGGSFSFEPMIVGAADANGDGDVTGAEWRAFSQGLERDGALDKGRLKARVVAASLDRDNDGQATVRELSEALAALDTDGDGALQAGELSARGGRRGLGLGVVLQAADANADGEVSARELDQLLAAAGAEPEAAASEQALVAWVDLVQSRSGEDRTAFTPSVMLLSIDGALDANRDGRADGADLAALFATLDADGNGTVAAAELRPQRAAGQGAGGGGESFRQADDAQRARPPLVRWQRSLEDALELQKRSGKPLLICVNMDAEPASESLAWFRYRDPEFARLTEGFVALLVSPDRHTPIDHDDRGRRMSDPRFGSVVEREHIDHEPALYERYFEGTRVAPRHVGIAADGTRLFDIYLTNELTLIDQALARHGQPSVEQVEPAGQGGQAGRRRRFDSPDAADRAALEARFEQSEWRARLRLVGAALDSSRFTQHHELVRMALRDPDPRVVRQALWTAVREPGLLAPELVGEALRASASDPTLRGALTGAFGRLARLSEDEAMRSRAERVFLAFEGLGLDSQIVDVERWSAALAGSEGFTPPALSAGRLDPLIEELSELEAAVAASPGDVDLRVQQAALLMQLAQVLLATGQDPSIALEEARAAAQAAEVAGDDSGRAAAVQCWTSYFQSDMPAAATHGARALPALVQDAGSALALETLHAFARARARQVYDALGTSEGYEPAWVADVRAAYEVLLAHPGGSERQAVELLGFLAALDARAEQEAFALAAVARFPRSADLHEWLRGSLLRDLGAAGLEAAYAQLAPQAESEAVFAWYAGLASFVAAERQVGNRDPQAALAAYGRSVERMRTALQAEPTYADTALHYVCLARAGQARLQAEAGRWDEAVLFLREGLEGRPQSATSADGLGNTPAATAQLVLRGLSAAGLDDQAMALREALDAAGVDLRARRQGE